MMLPFQTDLELNFLKFSAITALNVCHIFKKYKEKVESKVGKMKS
jgi:hypothetical protein